MIQKRGININFAQGLDTKTDPFQIPIGKFAALTNSIFTKGGLLKKRNGFDKLTSLPDETSTYATTFSGDLTAIGNRLQAYSYGTKTWVDKGEIQPVSLDTLPLIRNNLNQTQADSVVAPNGLVCTAYTEQNDSTNTYKYVVSDSVTGQNIVAPTALSTTSTLGTPRVFLMDRYFVIVYTTLVTGNSHLTFIAISISDPTTITAPADITTNYTPNARLAFDGAVLSGSLFVAWNGASSSGIKMATVSSGLLVSGTVALDASHTGIRIGLCSDVTTNVVWVTYFTGGGDIYALAVDPQLALILAPTLLVGSVSALNLAPAATGGRMTLFYEVTNAYGYDAAIPTNFVRTYAINQTGSGGAGASVLRSVGLASKAFYIGSTLYALVVYSSPYQPTYFLTDSTGHIVAKLAYGNGRGYLATGLPSATVTSLEVQIAYLFKDLITAVNKDTNVVAGTQTAGIYSQTGINLASLTFNSPIVTAEIGNNLNISGGFLWAYDGYSPVEQGFFLWPDSVKLNTTTGAGSISAQQYFYQVTYEWTDNQGNAFRSSPSIPVSITTTTASSTNTIYVPTLRLTYKTANPVKIVVYRWSTAQQVYYQVTSITAPVLNDPTADAVSIDDTSSDATILGNNILYTTGGVIENIGPPASSAVTLFDDRLWLVDAEDPNLLWYSKQVIESTPVEMSDLLTIYVAPTIGSQGSTGPIVALGAMDDKLIIFKEDAIYYINGSGPDNTGANSQYSQPIFITSSVGSANQRSIVLSPQGLLFQSDKGIWMLGRDLSTSYIGAPVEAFNETPIQGALGIPGTNQDRFTSSSGVCQMFDYYYQQWGTFTNLPAVSSTLFQGLHTYISPLGQVFQETPDKFLDGTSPVLLNLTTGWLNLAGLQGYQRAFFFYLLGKYLSPFKLVCSVAYDYNPAPSHFTIITPDNFNPVYGGTEANGQDTVYGTDSPYGGPENVLNWRIFLKKQRCSAIQITLQEVYDPAFGIVAGEGFSLSGIQVVVGMKSEFRPMSSARTVGTK